MNTELINKNNTANNLRDLQDVAEYFLKNSHNVGIDYDNRQEVHFMNDERVILSERPEDLKKAVEWGREEQKKVLNEKGEQLAEILMEKMTPFILKRNATK